ncbi:MAG: hypothetical protein BWY15_00593 [Firmicutes bacterium ADurb.Bin193]|nr:MAG: hypothetical protein BWY15_00593 [Firmicutes bacterium ADurb.Bin193]
MKMKRILALFIVTVLLLTGCGFLKQNKAPTPADLPKLIEKANSTTDKEEREKLLAEIQVLLESMEKNAPKE